MRKLTKALLFWTLTLSIQAGAINGFVSVIDVGATNNLPAITILSSNDEISLEALDGRRLSYRGRPIEIVEIFKKIGDQSQTRPNRILFEINDATGTISFSVEYYMGSSGYRYEFFVVEHVQKIPLVPTGEPSP